MPQTARRTTVVGGRSEQVSSEVVQASEMNLGEQEEEFLSYSPEVRQAALEYARGLLVVPSGPEPDLDGEPQFILVGVQQHGRAILFASTDVKTTKFARQMVGVDMVRVGGATARVPRLAIYVGAELRSFEQYVGADYREGLVTLLGEWERKRGVRQRAEHRTPQLPPPG